MCGGSERWLKLATTILYVGVEGKDGKRIVDVVCETRPSLNAKEVERAAAELQPLLAGR